MSGSDSGFSRSSSALSGGCRSPETMNGMSGDTEAGPDIADDEFRPATEVFKDPNAFDFLSQHGGSSNTASQLARESLYVKFDPLIGGRPSVMASVANNHHVGHRDKSTNSNGDVERPSSSEKNLIAMNSPSPKKVSNSSSNHDKTHDSDQSTPSRPSNIESSANLDNLQQLEFQEQLLKKERSIADLEKVIKEKSEVIEKLRLEASQRRESEEQMKQVLTEYEKTISELIAEKEKEKDRFEEERQMLQIERDQAVEDLRNVESAFADVHRKYERTKQVVEGFRHNEEGLKR